MEDKPTNNSDSNFPEDRSSDEIIDLLRNFYDPEDGEMQEFNEFYNAIDQKITQQNPVSKINRSAREMDASFYSRQMKLENLSKNLEQREFQVIKINRTKLSYTKAMIAAFAVCLVLALAGIANFTNAPKYQFLNLDDENFDWKSIELTDEQKKKIEEINRNWMSYSSQERGVISAKKKLLAAELKKDKPDFSLVDKYQRDVLDHETNLKREKLNTAIEKRVLLNSEQSIKLIRSTVQ